jgi:succinoglycan biosynthesis transport protein ExoP
MNELSPYFIRRTVEVEKDTVEPRALSSAVEETNPLLDYWQTIKRHRWLIGICALAIFLCSALYTFTRVPLYTAEATLLIERKTPQFLKVQDTRSDLIDIYDDFYKTQYEILKSSSIAERVVRDEGLQNNPVFTGSNKKAGFIAEMWQHLKKWSEGFTPAKPKNNSTVDTSSWLVKSYLGKLEVKPVKGTSVVGIRFTTPDPQLSARLANAHVSAYRRYGIDLRSQTNDEAAVFLQEKLIELRERVAQSEAALNSYRKNKGIISVDTKENIVVDRLADLNKSLTSAEIDRVTLEAQVRSIKGRNYDEVPAVRGSASINALKAELSKSEADYVVLAKEFKAGYPPLDTLKARIEEIRSRMEYEIQKEVKAIETAYAAAKNKETQLRATMEEQKKATLDLKDSAVQYTVLDREVDTNRQLYDGVLQRLKEIGVAADARNSNVYVLSKAEPSLSPASPNVRRYLMLGLFLGLVGGMGLALLLEQLDNTFKSPEEVERYVRLPNLAVMPDFALINNGNTHGYISRLINSVKSELPTKKSSDEHRQLVLDHRPLSLVVEAYRSLRSSVLLSQAGGPPQTVLFASAACAEGKTTTVVNTAVMFAQMGIRVLIIDADLRSPACHRLLKMENNAGLVEILTGQVVWQYAIKPAPTENLFLMSSGSLPPNPAELLGSTNMHDLLQQLREHYEFIFVDSSPVMAVTDAVLVSTIVDGTVLVIDRNTPKALLRKARIRLSTPHTKILGTLLNRVDIRNGEYKSYYQQYYQYYREDPATAPNTPPTSAKRNKGLFEKHSVSRPLTSELPVEQAPHNEPSSVFLQRLVTKLTEAMGPMAPLVLRDHVLAVGECSDALPKAKLEQLVKRVSQEILVDSIRQRFEQEMLKEIQNA